MTKYNSIALSLDANPALGKEEELVGRPVLRLGFVLGDLENGRQLLIFQQENLENNNII